MKYIMFQFGDKLVPVIFPSMMNHVDVAKALQGKLAFSRFKPVSAGEVTGLVVLGCSGKSETLDLPSAPEDSTTINAYDYTHGETTGQEAHWERLVLMAHAVAPRGEAGGCKPMTHDPKYKVLTPVERSWLAHIQRAGKVSWGWKRPLPAAVWTLVDQGLVFRSHFALALTDRGEEALERVA